MGSTRKWDSSPPGAEGSGGSDPFDAVGEAIGREIAGRGHIALACYPTHGTAGYEVLRGMGASGKPCKAESLVIEGDRPRPLSFAMGQLTVRPLTHDAGRGSAGHVIKVALTQMEALSRADCMVIIRGYDKTTLAQVHAAQVQTPYLPYAGLGGVAKTIWTEWLETDRALVLDRAEVAKLTMPAVEQDPADLASTIVDALERISAIESRKLFVSYARADGSFVAVGKFDDYLVNEDGDIYAIKRDGAAVEAFDPSREWDHTDSEDRPDRPRTLASLTKVGDLDITVEDLPRREPGKRVPPAAGRSRGGKNRTQANFDRLTEALGHAAEALERSPDRSPFLVEDRVGGRRISLAVEELSRRSADTAPSTLSEVFISYSRSDAAYVDRLVEHLDEAGVASWVDRTTERGDNWVSELTEAIDHCPAMIVVMTPAAGNSKWVNLEILRALQSDKPIFPLLLDGPPFFLLNDRHHDDVSDGALPSDAFLEDLQKRMVDGA